MDHHAKHACFEAATGALGELVRRSGHKYSHAHGAGKAGEWTVQGLAKVAPGAVAAGAAATGTMITAATPVVVAVAPFVAVAAAGYGIYRFAKWATS